MSTPSNTWKNNILNNKLLLAFLVALAAQVSLGLFVPDFKISLGGILFPLLLYLMPQIGAIGLGFLSGIGVFGLRVLISLTTQLPWQQGLLAYYPEFFFYFIYGILYALFTHRSRPINPTALFPLVVACDIAANLVELTIRSINQPTGLTIKVIAGLLVVALLRAGLLWLILQGMLRYKRYVLEQERYRKLIWLTSQLNAEIVWLRKNMDQIERVMADAYVLFEKITQDKAKETWANLSISIARDVHEIKKEYNLLLQGLEEVVEHKLDDPQMDWHTILSLLQELLFQGEPAKQRKITADIIPGLNFFTHQHYYLLSIFRNLLVNAQEALQGVPYPGRIILEHEISGDYHLFRVKDNGRGIELDDQVHIFTPGFSTKIDYTTGQIHRGLGLSLVKELVEKKLQGEISVTSVPNKGTTFLLKIPKKALELNGS